MNVFLIYKELNTESKYYEILKRFNNNEKLIERFFELFLEDISYTNLIESYKNNDLNNLYLSSHSLKGVSLNLGFTNLALLCDKLCKIIKKSNEKYHLITNLINDITINYNYIVNLINKHSRLVNIFTR